MRPENDRFLMAVQRRLRYYQHMLVILSFVWVALVGFNLLSQMTAEDMANHRSQIIQERVHACSGDFNERFDCTQNILLAGQRTGAWEFLKRISLTLLLPSVAWAVWWIVLKRIRQMVWLPPAVGRSRYFA